MPYFNLKAPLLSELWCSARMLLDPLALIIMDFHSELKGKFGPKLKFDML